jgi:hypothetical protein
MIPTISQECSEFLEQSRGLPLIKPLPRNGDGFRRVKVRKRKTDNPVYSTLNTAFSDYAQLAQRAIFVETKPNLEPSDMMLESFYIFPINGFKFLYCPQVKSSTKQYQESFDRMLNVLSEDAAKNLLSDVLKRTYISDRLHEGINGECELIIYDIPYFYAVRKSIVNDYYNFFYK